MKKIFAFIAAVTMMCAVLTTTAFADGYVVSPEPGGNTPPPSPQTGYETGIGAVAGIALAGGVVAYVSARKLRQQA